MSSRERSRRERATPSARVHAPRICISRGRTGVDRLQPTRTDERMDEHTEDRVRGVRVFRSLGIRVIRSRGNTPTLVGWYVESASYSKSQTATL